MKSKVILETFLRFQFLVLVNTCKDSIFVYLDYVLGCWLLVDSTIHQDQNQLLFLNVKVSLYI